MVFVGTVKHQIPNKMEHFPSFKKIAESAEKLTQSGNFSANITINDIMLSDMLFM